MTLALSVVLFCASSVLVLSAIYAISEALLLAGTIGVVLSGAHIGLVMGLRRYAYTAVLFLFHLAMTVLAVYIYLNRDLVILTTHFVFSTFTDENLRIALVVFTTTLLSTLAPWLLLVQGKTSILKISPKKAFVGLFGQLGFLKKSWIQAILLISFLSAMFLFFTNTTVLEVSYPLNRRLHWIPGELLKIPTFLAAIGIVACYFKYLHQGSRYFFTLTIARINIVMTPILMLMLTGSRGLFTFLWFFVGLFESYLFLKRRSALIWSVLFFALAWFAYISWPFLRAWGLSSMPIDAALLQALEIGLFLSPDSDAGQFEQSSIHIQDFPLVGASLFQLLYVIQLIEDGVSLGGATFINLMPQALPSWLDGVLWERPLNDNWRLGEYYYHGGGFLAIANAYWNGGLVVTMVFVLVLSTLFVGFDRYLLRSRTGILYKLVYWLWIPVMVVQLAYGIQGLARVVELLAVVIVIDQIIRRKSFQRSAGSGRGLRWRRLT